MTAVVIPIATGEVLLAPAELWKAIDGAIAAASLDGLDNEGARQAFGQAFVAGLHAQDLALISRRRSGSKETVAADTYALALDGKHAAERTLGLVGALVKGGTAKAADLAAPLLEELGAGVLALTGRRPPAERARVQTAMLRLRAIAALLDGLGDVGAMPPFDPELQLFFREIGQ